MIKAIIKPTDPIMLATLLMTDCTYLKEVFRAVANGKVGFLLITQDNEEEIPVLDKEVPHFIIFGDDLFCSKGPSAFTQEALDLFESHIYCTCIMAGAALDAGYEELVKFAIEQNCSVAMIETQPEHEDEWSKLVEKASLPQILLSPTVGEQP